MPRKANSDKPKDKKAVSIGRNIKLIREAKGMSRNDVLAAVGLKDQMSISRWETGVRIPSMKRLSQLADLFGVSIADLTCDETILLNHAAAFSQINAYQRIHEPAEDTFECAEQALSDARNIVKRASIYMNDSQLDVMIAKCNELLSALHDMKKERTSVSQLAIGG